MTDSKTVTVQERLVWQSTTPVFTRFITDTRYRKLRPSFQRWYKPICDCMAAQLNGGRNVG